MGDGKMLIDGKEYCTCFKKCLTKPCDKSKLCKVLFQETELNYDWAQGFGQSHFERSSIAPLIIKSKGPSIIDVNSKGERGHPKKVI